MGDDVPLFDDDTGEALNDAARQLVLDALAADLRKPAGGSSDDSAPLGEALSSIAPVVCAVGTYKYVQVQLTSPDAPGAQLLVVRSYNTCLVPRRELPKADAGASFRCPDFESNRKSRGWGTNSIRRR